MVQSLASLSATRSVQVRADDWLKKAVHVSFCLCNDACKRSLAICRKGRALGPVSRPLSVPIWPAFAKQGRKYDSINQSMYDRP